MVLSYKSSAEFFSSSIEPHAEFKALLKVFPERACRNVLSYFIPFAPAPNNTMGQEPEEEEEAKICSHAGRNPFFLETKRSISTKLLDEYPLI